jgi:malonyl-CoA O-methyltransferase
MLLASKLVDKDIKKNVASAFGDHAKDYIKYAHVQRQAAEFMVSMFEDIIITLEPPYIELGAGTGFVTQSLVPLLPEGDFYVTDISEEMLNVCRHNLTYPKKMRVHFEQRDAEKSLSDNQYGLIITALTAQWFSNTEMVLLRLLESLKPGGVLLYSYMDERCFPEWKVLCAETGIPFTGNQLPSSAPLQINSTRFNWEYSSSDLFTETYESPSDFFRNLKRIGAGTQTSSSKGNYGAILALNEYWLLKNKSNFQITYGITFGAIRRKYD